MHDASSTSFGPAPVAYSSIAATDAIEFSEQVRDWQFEFSQLEPGNFRADGAVVELDGVSVAHATLEQTLLHRGYAPRNMAALLIPGAGSGPAFARGQLLDAGHCVTLADGEFLEAVTHGHYVDVAVGFDMNACQEQLDAMTAGPLPVSLGRVIASPGTSWIRDMLGRVDWLIASAGEYPQSLLASRVRASLGDHLLAAIVTFDSSPADVDTCTRQARAGRRVAVRLARELIHDRLSEPLRLSELCRHARLKIRSLEYGFREVTGLTPVAYIRVVRLNTVRRALRDNASNAHRSISEIAMDSGFWHLSQFSADYRSFFGETPTHTRRRATACHRPTEGREALS